MQWPLVVINPGANFAGEPRDLATELDKYYGVNQDAARAQPTIDRALDGVVGKLRGLETTQRPVLVTFGAEQRNILDWYNQEGLRENLQSKFQIRSSTVTLDVEEALHALSPKERNIGRRDACALLGMNPNGTRNDAAAAQILQMLPRVVDKLRATGQKVDTLADLERVMRPGAHHWNVKEGMWEEATK